MCLQLGSNSTMLSMRLNLLLMFRHAHPGSPYVYGHVGVDRDLDFPEPMPVVGKRKIKSCSS